ncbi:MAG: aminotransferase, partial [Betaproteobacteria bacterium]|nr:aminotransferase [Betaproteobacteria bacterium]
AGVSIVPGGDFGLSQADDWVRFSYAAPQQVIEEAIARLENWLDSV